MYIWKTLPKLHNKAVCHNPPSPGLPDHAFPTLNHGLPAANFVLLNRVKLHKLLSFLESTRPYKRRSQNAGVYCFSNLKGEKKLVAYARSVLKISIVAKNWCKHTLPLGSWKNVLQYKDTNDRKVIV